MIPYASMPRLRRPIGKPISTSVQGAQSPEKSTGGPGRVPELPGYPLKRYVEPALGALIVANVLAMTWALLSGLGWATVEVVAKINAWLGVDLTYWGTMAPEDVYLGYAVIGIPTAILLVASCVVAAFASALGRLIVDDLRWRRRKAKESGAPKSPESP